MILFLTAFSILPQAASEATTATAGRSCTVEQIATMVKACLSDQQIKAACPD